MNILLADDLTGSCDAGIKFAAAGLPVSVAIGPAAIADMEPRTGILAVNADTRGLKPVEAFNRTAQLCKTIQTKIRKRPDLLYKKLDSTLRGNPGPEIRAVADAWNSACVLVAVASPEMGRTVNRGILNVDGVPLAKTAFGMDPGSPMRESEVLKILGDYLPGASLIGADIIAAKTANLADIFGNRKETQYLIFDSTSQRELETIAQAGLRMEPRPIFAGSAGLAHALAHSIGGEAPVDVPPKLRRMLFVCGSANRATHAQVDALQAAGLPVVVLEGGCSEPGVAKYANMVADLLRDSSVCLTAGRKRLPDAQAASAQINALSAITRKVLCHISPASSGIFITGGETAFSILGDVAGFMRLQSELLPGIVAASLEDGPFQGLTVVTKAGGFGSENTLLEILHILT